jgi:hypothetical protein
MDRILRHNTHLLFPLEYSPALSPPLFFPSLTRQDITTPAHPLRIHTRQERTQQKKIAHVQNH